MTKETLRKTYKERRSLLKHTEIDVLELELFNNLLSLPIWDKENYHVFLSAAGLKEINTEPLLSILQGKDKNIVVPKVTSATDMVHYLLTDGTKLEMSKWGIPEPTNGLVVLPKILDVVFVPLLVMDKQGHRVGYGKGFYDRFLSQCNPDTIKIGLSLFEPIEKISGVEDTDVPLDYGVTPEEVFLFSK